MIVSFFNNNPCCAAMIMIDGDYYFNFYTTVSQHGC